MRAVVAVVTGLLVATLASPPANAQALQGNALLRMCENPQSPVCAAYFVGFVSGAMMSDAERAAGKPICLSGVSAKALRRAFMRFAKRHPGLARRHADGLVATAAATSFPCKRPSGRH